MSKPDLSTYGGRLREVGYVGELANLNAVVEESRTNLNATAIQFGGPVARDSAGCKPFTSISHEFLGFAIRHAIRPTIDTNNTVAISQYDQAAIMKSGWMFESPAEAVVAGDNVVIIITAGVATLGGSSNNENVGAGTAHVGNTGNGSVGAVTLGSQAEVGNYILTCISTSNTGRDGVVGGTNVASAGTSSAINHVSGSTSNPTITASPATGAGCKVGTYQVVFIEPATDLGTFEVFDPDGLPIGTGKVGVAFTTHVTFTITDGSTDAAAGDYFTITVAAANAGTFSVKTPSGYYLPNLTVAVAYTSDHINLTVADGSIDWAVADYITVAVTTDNRVTLSNATWEDTVDEDGVGRIYLAGPSA